MSYCAGSRVTPAWRPALYARSVRLVGRRAIAGLVIGLYVWAVGCGGGEDRSGRFEINVAAAANLVEPFREIASRFEAQSGIKVTLSFGSTAALAQQIENGAPFDLFAAADTAHIDGLAAKGILDKASRAVYAHGSLVV